MGDILCNPGLLCIVVVLIWIVVVMTMFMCLPIRAATLVGYPWHPTNSRATWNRSCEHVVCGVIHMVFPNVRIFPSKFFSLWSFFRKEVRAHFLKMLPQIVYLDPTPILFVHLLHIMCQLYVCNPVVPGSLWFVVLFHNASCSRALTTQHQCQSMSDGWVCGAWT